MQIESFLSDIEFDETRVKTKVIIETSFSKEIRILLKENQLMKEHQTPFPILINIVSGEIELGVNGINHTMKSGDIIALEGSVPHNLLANTDTIVRLTLSKHDKVERLENVINS